MANRKVLAKSLLIYYLQHMFPQSEVKGDQTLYEKVVDIVEYLLKKEISNAKST